MQWKIFHTCVCLFLYQRMETCECMEIFQRQTKNLYMCMGHLKVWKKTIFSYGIFTIIFYSVGSETKYFKKWVIVKRGIGCHQNFTETVIWGIGIIFESMRKIFFNYIFKYNYIHTDVFHWENGIKRLVCCSQLSVDKLINLYNNKLIYVNKFFVPTVKLSL